MSKKPWFKFYCSDYLLDEKVTRLPLDAQAILIRIWCIIWLHGCIPSEPEEISKRIGVPTNDIQKHLQNLLQILDKDEDGSLYSARMDVEMEKYERISIVRTAAVKSRYSKVVATNVGTKTHTKEPTNGSTKPLRSESESDTTTPLPPKRGKRRTKLELISAFSEPTREVVNTVLEIWPKERPGNHSRIKPDTALLASRVDQILQNPKVTSEILLGAANIYLAEKKDFPHAPEFFFGPGNNGDGPPWLHYARMAYHNQQRQAVTQ